MLYPKVFVNILKKEICYFLFFKDCVIFFTSIMTFESTTYFEPCCRTGTSPLGLMAKKEFS